MERKKRNNNFFNERRRMFLTSSIGFCLSSCIRIPLNLREESSSKLEKFILEPINLKEFNIPGNYIIALSNISEGLVNQSKNRVNLKRNNLIQKIVNKAKSPKINPYNKDLRLVNNFGDYGFYLGHLNVIIGLTKKLGEKSKENEQLHKRLSYHLREKSLIEKTANMKSFQGRKERYPADQSTILYSLHLFDEINKTDISDAPTKKWLRYMEEKATDPKTGLPLSEITGTKTGSYPRGCALSWSIRYINKFAPKKAKILWERYKKHFKENYIFVAGFREWPRGIDKKSDIDSGPIIQEIGAAATAFAIGASKEVGDYFTFNQLKNLDKLISFYIKNFQSKGYLSKIYNDNLAQAIRFNMYS